MTTKKSKPASLTSSLLARKGEAEPATSPYSIPEAGRQRPADAASGGGNGSGGDLGRALSNMAASESGDKASREEISENGMHAAAGRTAEPRQPQRAAARPGAQGGSAEGSDPEDQASEAATKSEAETRKESPEEVFVESAVAEEVTLDEAVIEASVSGGQDRKEAPPDGDAASEMVPLAASSPESPSDAAGAEAEPSDSDREAARDARLLRFVYAMAALTGVVAIVLYAGGWLRDGPKQQKPEAPIAAAPAVTTPAASESPAPGDATPAPAQQETAAAAPESSSTPVIPPAPPIAPPDAASEKPTAAETGVTTGGPAKPAPETTPPGTDSPGNVGVAVAPPAVPAESDRALMQPESGKSGSSASPGGSETPVISVPVPTPVPGGPDAAKGAAAPTGSGEQAATAEAPASRATQAAEADSKPIVVPTPAAPESTTPPPAVSETVREVPNMRVLAPAIGRPTPAETAPATGSSAPPSLSAAVPKLEVPPVKPGSAAVPKAAPKPAAPTGDGRYRVQLASVNSEALAKREWARLQKAFPDVFGDRSLVVEKKEIEGRGTFYRVQTGGYNTLDDARAVCAGLKAKNQACLPVKR